MNYDDIQFGNYDPELDFTSDITGTNTQSSLNDETDNPEDTGLPQNFWFQSASNASIISNNDLPGVADDKFSKSVKLNENRLVINKVNIMAMHGADAFQLERTSKLSFSSEDFEKNPFLRNSLFILPMVGPLFWSCWPYPSEEESRQDLRRRTGLKPVFVSECSKCSSCKFKNLLSLKTIFCSKLGLPIFNNDFNTAPPSEILAHLRIAGYLPNNKNECSWDDIRKVIIFPPERNAIQTYKQYAPPKKEVLPGAQYRKGLLELNRMHYEKQAQEEKYNRDRFILSVCYPLITKVQESFLKNKQNDTAINDYIQKILLPDNYKSECLQIVDALKKDILLWAGVRFYLSSYQKCDDAEQFLRRNNLRVPYSVQRQDCTYCIDNKSGFCKRLECRLVTYKEDITPIHITWTVDGITQNTQLSENLTEGANTITRTATDLAGNTGSSAIVVHLDTQAPVLSVIKPSKDTTVYTADFDIPIQ